VQLFTRRGYDWTTRYPAIAATAAKLRARSFTLDGEAGVCGPEGVAVFGALHRRGTVSEAMLYAFDLLELDGEDLRALPVKSLSSATPLSLPRLTPRGARTTEPRPATRSPA
jgi:bifunctional non-homologous end joining protein LigD